MFEKTKEARNAAFETTNMLVKSEIRHFKLKLVRSLTKWISRLVTGFIFIIVLLLCLMFLGMAAAMGLQTYFSAAVSFLLVGGLFALMGVSVIVFRQRIIAKGFLQLILSEVFDES